MRRSIRIHSALVCLIALTGCGGRSIDLDRADVSVAGSTGSGAITETVHLGRSIIEFQVDESRVYWITAGEPTFNLQSCVYEDCDRTLLTYGESQGPIALDANDLFFPSIVDAIDGLSGYTLFRAAKSGVGGPQKFMHDLYLDWVPTTDANYLYWFSTFDILRCPLAQCGEIPEVVAKIASPGSPLIVQSGRIYWLDGELRTGTNMLGAGIYAAPVDGSGPALELAPGNSVQMDTGSQTWLAVDQTNIYWIDGDFHVRGCPRTGCNGKPPLPLVMTDSPKRNLMVDEAGLYWLDTESYAGPVNIPIGTVRFCPLAGCAAHETPKALTPNAAREFRMSSKYLYWNEPAVTAQDVFGIDKVIYRTAKP